MAYEEFRTSYVAILKRLLLMWFILALIFYNKYSLPQPTKRGVTTLSTYAVALIPFQRLRYAMTEEKYCFLKFGAFS